MSDTHPINDDSGKAEISAAVASAKAEIDALLDDLKSKKAAFDTIAETSTRGVSAELDKAKVANQEIATLRNEVVSAKGTMDTEREGFLSKTKSVQTEIEDTRNNIATIKGAIESTQSAVVADAQSVAQAKVDAEKIKASANALSESLSKEHDGIANQISDLQTKKDSLAEILTQLANIKATAEGDSGAIKTHLEEIDKTKDRLAKLNTSSGEQYDLACPRF